MHDRTIPPGPGAAAGEELVAAAGHTRRGFVGRVAVGVAAAGPATLLGQVASATAHDDHECPRDVVDFIATQEQFGVTFLTAAIQAAPGTPSAQFLDVLKAANTTEFDHVQGIKEVGGKPQVSRYWIPDAAFGGGGAGLFASIEAVETIEISLYLVGVTVFTGRRHGFGSRLCAEALGTEAEHRVLARFAQTALGHPVGVPNNVGFEAYLQRSAHAAKKALEDLGIGYGERGATPGRFYDYPGDPLANGTGLPVESNAPA